MNVCAKFRGAPLCIKKALEIFRQLITTTRRTTRVAFWDQPSGSKNNALRTFQSVAKTENFSRTRNVVSECVIRLGGTTAGNPVGGVVACTKCADRSFN